MASAPGRPWPGFALLACAALLAACAQKPDPAMLAERTLKAQTLLDTYYGGSAQLDEAGRLLDGILRDAPHYAPAHAQAARVVIMNGHIVAFEFVGNALERAEKILLEAKALDPHYAETHSLLGHVYTLSGMYPQAEAALRQADSLGSNNPWTQVNWGHLFMKQKRWQEAQIKFFEVIDAARKTTPQELKAYVAAIEFQRNLYARSGPKFAAEVRELCDLALASTPQHDAWSWGNCGNDLSIVGDFDASIEKSRGALARMSYGAGRYTLACGLIGKWGELTLGGKRKEAQKYYTEAAATYPNLEELTENFCGGSPKHLAIQKLLKERLEGQ